jgi:LPXTG-site transpeptidase (sortase) family protein
MTYREPRRGLPGSRRSAILAAVVAVVAAGVMVTACAGPDTASPTPGTGLATSPAFTDLPLVPVPSATTGTAPTPTASVAPAPGSASASPSATATAASAAAAGIHADRIRIARLGIDLKIIEGDGIDAPIGKAAHYPGSAWPGAGSNIYIYGHAREGMFLTLWKARVGDVIELGLVDGTARTYVVDQVLPKVPWDAMEYVRPTATEQLTLQTSTSYHPTSPRFIVIALPAP